MTPPASAPDTVPRLGIIGGSSFLDGGAIQGGELREVVTPRGTVKMHVGPDFVFLRRHGEDVYRPPHRIPHHAHVLALHELGVRHVAAFASSGSLREEIRPGDVLVPDDYLSLHDPPTFACDEYLHIVPELDAGVRTLLLEAAARALGPSPGAESEAPAASSPASGSGGTATEPAPPGPSAALRREGVYAETRGPRFETRAEVRMLARHAHVVGMTAASEATLCQERGIAYAVICTVDNWAHGIGSPPLTVERFQAQLAANAVIARRILVELLRLWREGVRP